MSAPEPADAAVPTLTVGLPVYNGARYLPEALDALLAQTYTDYELVISDNASTDETADVCRAYAARDERIRYVRQPVNIGAVPNHNYLIDQARGKYFKWASHDDLYEPDLLRRCVQVLDEQPEVVLAHSWDAMIGEDGEVLRVTPYVMDTENPRPSVRLHDMLYTPGGNDFYGVVRTDALRRVGPHGTYYNSDRVFVSALCLQGPFHQVPEVMYYRRDHPGRASHAGGKRAVAAALAPGRASRLRNPMLRMHVEYVVGFVRAIRRAPLTTAERRACLLEVAKWFWSVLPPRGARGGPDRPVAGTVDAGGTSWA
jgi:glycosyltransferase involved in cell wall biosynthesis